MVAVKKDKINGDALGTGRRKSSVARVRMSPGSGTITINKKPADTYFTREDHRQIVTAPLRLTKLLGSYDIIARVGGGGITGQAGAVSLGCTA